MIKIITATNSPKLNEELMREKDIQVPYKDIFYKEGILEILEKDTKIDYIIIDENLSGEIEINNLIEKILEKNKKIKIIVTIKKENKNKIIINNKKIIQIFYEGKINLEKIKNNKIKNNKINNKKIKEKDKNFKIISILGEIQIEKSIFALNLSYYLSSKDCKILLVKSNEETPNIFSNLWCKKINKKTRKNRRKFKNSCKKESGKFFIKYVDEKILKNMIIKINKNIDLLFYNKLINFNLLKNIENKYDYLIIENYLKKINKKIINNSYKKILIIKPNLLGLKNSKKIIEKNKLNKNNNLKILINNYNKNLIDEKIIKNIFKEDKIIGKINYKIEYEKIINKIIKN